MKKKITFILMVIGVGLVFNFDAYSDCRSYFWGISADSGFECPSKTKQTVTWRIIWGDGTGNEKSNYAYGSCSTYSGNCAPVFNDPEFSDEIIGGQQHVIWTELARDRRKSGNFCQYYAHRTAYKDHPCNTTSGGNECYIGCSNTPKTPADKLLYEQPPSECCSYSPILIDVSGDGFALTDAANGVMFDFNGDGVASQISWTAGGADDAWLVLDRDENGLIESSLEMFGNFTDQPDHPKRNGFLALAEYDKTENGGNGDGSIDNQDAVFSSLRLWQDLNHNGISEASELDTLLALNVAEIELDYKKSKKTDEFGNEFRYRAKVWSSRDKLMKGKNKVGRWAWDVFLKLEQPNN